MNFRQVATEIMLTANEEKWQETRGKIERALFDAARLGASSLERFISDCDTITTPTARFVKLPYRVDADRGEGFSIQHWQDQADGKA